MENKKRKKIIIISIIVIILLILVLLSAIYFTTDIFKSDKQLFIKYAMQIVDSKNGFIENSIEQYNNKKENNAYANEGSLSFNTEIPGQNQEQSENLNNTNFKFSGQVDTANSKSLQKIDINYSDDVKFPLSYKQIENNIGIQTDYIGKKYITIDTENLQQLEKNLNINGLEDIKEGIEKITKLSKNKLTDEEITHIKNTYVDIFKQEIKNLTITKVEENDEKGYKLILNKDDLKRIYLNILQTLKNDQQTIDIINKYIDDEKITTEDIDDMIQEIEETEDLISQPLEITIYQNNMKTTRIVVYSDNNTIQISKIKESEDIVQYNISYEKNSDEQKLKIYFNIKYSGLKELNNINENYELGIEFDIENNILNEANNAKNQTQINSEKEKINMMVAEIKVNKITNNVTGDLSIEDIENLKNNSSDNYYSNMDIEQKEENKIQITFIDTNHLFEIDKDGNIIKEPELNLDDKSTENSTCIYKINFNNNIKFDTKIDIEDFSEDNALYLNELQPEQANNFLNAVTERISEVNKQQMEQLGLNENENPIITSVSIIPSLYIYNTANSVISEQTDDIESMEKSTFNQKFKQYEGENIRGSNVKMLLSSISTDEEQYSIENIKFENQDYDITQENIELIKDNIQSSETYKIELKYNNSGYVNEIIIIKQ